MALLWSLRALSELQAGIQLLGDQSVLPVMREQMIELEALMARLSPKT